MDWRLMPPLARKRLLIVAGKGGVGRSTVAAALGLAGARSGLRTIVVETAGRGDVAVALGGRAGEPLTEIELEPGLHHLTISRRQALEEYLRQELPSALPAVLLARSRAFELFVDAAPGMSDLLTIGKVWELGQRPRRKPRARPYDLIVLDGPASGQLVGLLGAAETFSAIARIGPIARQADTIDAMLRDAGTVGVIAVATAEQMAVTEALELRNVLANRFGLGFDGVVVNRLFSSRFRPAERRALAGAAGEPAVQDALWFDGRARVQRAHLARLRRGLRGVPVTTLPFRFTYELGRTDIEDLSARLGGVPE
ncbi:MAG TPA: ArsA-related P-loop ATPase [Solirubrobacteraceae bacterium]|nr:ArsA-related P-loop ATPase [Solirubrobacteraceae bacterium]